MKNHDILTVVGNISFIYCLSYFVMAVIYFVLNTKQGRLKFIKFFEKLSAQKWITKNTFLVISTLALFKFCLTINLILFNPLLLVLVLYAYFTNAILLCIFIRNTSKLSKYYKMAINPYQQFKLFHILLKKEYAYFDFSLQYWCLLMAFSTFLPIGILPMLFVTQFWPFLIYLEFFYLYRSEKATSKRAINSFVFILVQLITFNLLQPVFLTLAVIDGSKNQTNID